MKKSKKTKNKNVTEKIDVKSVIKEVKKLMKARKNLNDEQPAVNSVLYPRMVHEFASAMEKLILCMRLFSAIEKCKEHVKNPDLPAADREGLNKTISDGEKLLEDNCGVPRHVS